MSDDNWHNDSVQFPRLLCEAYAVLTVTNLAEIAKSMDLPLPRVLELFGRAERAWDTLQRRGIIR